MFKQNRRREPIVRFQLNAVRVDLFEPLFGTERIDVFLEDKLVRSGEQREIALASLLDHLALALKGEQATPLTVTNLSLYEVVFGGARALEDVSKTSDRESTA